MKALFVLPFNRPIAFDISAREKPNLVEGLQRHNNQI